MTYLPENQFGYGGILPAASIVDLLVIASTAFMLLLALMREQRGALIAELDRKGAESEAQRQVLETVFESMKDGVVIVDDAGSRCTTARRASCWAPIPAGQPDSWAEAFEVSGCRRGSTRRGRAARGSVRPPRTVDPAKTLEVRVGQGDAARILDVSAQPLGTAQRPRRSCCCTTSRPSGPGCGS